MNIYTETMTRYPVVGASGRVSQQLAVVYTQPKVDRIRYKLYYLWWVFLWKTKLESLQDRIFYLREHLDIKDVPPGAQHDIKLHYFNNKNRTVFGDVVISETIE